MKKGSFLTLLISSLLFLGSSCKKEDKPIGGCFPELPGNCYKGRLEIQDICGNYTIKVLEGNIDPSLIQTTWEHPTTKVTYQNVFSLGNICTFPANFKEGDTFYFTIRSMEKEGACAQCLAYAPTPNKTLSINVSTTPCASTSN